MAVRIGGQAVIEGVMMKNMDRYAVSVRKPNGKIETKVEECEASQRNIHYFNYQFSEEWQISWNLW